MRIVGMHYTTDAEGHRRTTLHVSDEFNGYYNTADKSRGCVGEKVESIYVGELDCSKLKVGMNVDISYDRAITTAKGSFQNVKRIDILDK